MGRIARVKLTLKNFVGSACVSNICVHEQNDVQLDLIRSIG